MIRSPSVIPTFVDPRRPNKVIRGRRLVFGVVLVFAAVLSLVYVRQTGDLAATGYDVAALQREKAQWETRNEQLRFDIARLQSLDRVSQIASDRLHLGPPRREIYVRATPLAVAPPPSSPTAPSEAVESAVSVEFRRLLGVP